MMFVAATIRQSYHCCSSAGPIGSICRTPVAVAYLASQLTRIGVVHIQTLNASYGSMVQDAQMSNHRTAKVLASFEKRLNGRALDRHPTHNVVQDAEMSNHSTAKVLASFEDRRNEQALDRYPADDFGGVLKYQVGQNVSRKDKINFLISTLLDLKDSKEAVYGALDAWVAWEQNFPIASLKMVLLDLEKEQQWHKVVQVIKWMLSKGQGTTMGTYQQLIRALDMDHRAEEAHRFWVKKIGTDLHSVPWQLCKSMISIYYRNNMLESLVKLFKGLEAFDRKPPEKSIVQKVADAYEVLGLLEEKNRVLEKYDDLFTDTLKGRAKKPTKAVHKKKKKSEQRKLSSTSGGLTHAVDGTGPN